jgi:hypothetical protein
MAKLGCLVSYLMGPDRQKQAEFSLYLVVVPNFRSNQVLGNSGLSTIQVNEHRADTRGIRKIPSCVRLRGRVLRRSWLASGSVKFYQDNRAEVG